MPDGLWEAWTSGQLRVARVPICTFVVDVVVDVEASC